jgi:hypothetical protein
LEWLGRHEATIVQSGAGAAGLGIPQPEKILARARLDAVVPDDFNAEA